MNVKQGRIFILDIPKMAQKRQINETEKKRQIKETEKKSQIKEMA